MIFNTSASCTHRSHTEKDACCKSDNITTLVEPLCSILATAMESGARNNERKEKNSQLDKEIWLQRIPQTKV